MSTTARLRSEAGYSIIELLVSSAIMITVTGAIFGLVNPSQGTSQTVPEVSDLQQRARVGSDVLFKEILMAGAGTYQGPVRSPLVNFFSPILPRRAGYTAPDPYNVFKTDAITVTYIPNTYSQTTISQLHAAEFRRVEGDGPAELPEWRAALWLHRGHGGHHLR